LILVIASVIDDYYISTKPNDPLGVFVLKALMLLSFLAVVKPVFYN